MIMVAKGYFITKLTLW